MAASIQSRLYYVSTGLPVPGTSTLTDISRDDLRSGYQVQCASVYDANTYSWTLAYTPDSSGSASSDFAGTPSNAALLPPQGSTSKTCKFNVDWNGSYLIRLVVDAGLPTESTMFLRMRSLTTFGELKLTAAGERRDGTGVVPSDASAAGWTADQNQNMLRLLAFTRRTATSGRVLYVDANRGRDNAADPNDPTNILRIPGTDSANLDATGIRAAAVGFGDFSSINDAIVYAQGAVARGEPVLSSDNPYLILVAPGLYEENLNLVGGISLAAATPAYGLSMQAPGDVELKSSFVTVRTVTGGHHTITDPGLIGCFVQGVLLESYLTESPLVTLEVLSGTALLQDTVVSQWAEGGVGFFFSPATVSYLLANRCSFYGTAVGMLFGGTSDCFILCDNSSIFSQGSGIGLPAVDMLGHQQRYSFSFCQVSTFGDHAVEGFPVSVTFSHTNFEGNLFFGGETGCQHDVSVQLNGCAIDGDLTVDGTNTSGTTQVGGGGSSVAGTVNITGATTGWWTMLV